MDLITLLITLLVVFVIGAAAYWVITKFFTDPTVRSILLAITGVILLIFLLYTFAPGIGHFRVGR